MIQRTSAENELNAAVDLNEQVRDLHRLAEKKIIEMKMEIQDLNIANENNKKDTVVSCVQDVHGSLCSVAHTTHKHISGTQCANE